MTADTPDQPITAQEMKEVRAFIRDLIQDSQRQERERQLLLATATWLNAFASFKRLRRRAGLPVGKGECLAYGALLGSIKGAGKALLCEVEKGFDPSPVVSLENFAACVAEMRDDDRILECGLLDQADAEVEALFA